MSKRTIVVELEVDVVDPKWTDQDILDNLPTYLALAIGTAEDKAHAAAAEADELEPYTVDPESVTVWLPEDHALDVADRMTVAPV